MYKLINHLLLQLLQFAFSSMQDFTGKGPVIVWCTNSFAVHHVVVHQALQHLLHCHGGLKLQVGENVVSALKWWTCHVCQKFRMSLMQHLINGITQNVKKGGKHPSVTSQNPNPHICSRFNTFTEHREGGCNKAPTWKASVVKYNPPTHYRLNLARTFSSSTNQTKKQAWGSILLQTTAFLLTLSSFSLNTYTYIYCRHPPPTHPNYYIMW